MHHYLYSYVGNTYNNEQQSYELVPIPGSNITKAVLFAGHDNSGVGVLPMLPRNTFLYLETDEPITSANRYQNLLLISQMVQLETGLPAEPVEIDTSAIHNFDEALSRYGSDVYYEPGVSYGGMVNTPDGIAKVATLCHFMNMASGEDATKFKNALQSFAWAQETSRVNPNLKYTLFMSLYLSSINQLANNPSPVCNSPLMCPDCGENLGKHKTSHASEMKDLVRHLITGKGADNFVALIGRLYHNLRSSYLHDGLLSGGEREGGFLAEFSSDDPRHIQLVEDMANVEVLNRILLGLFLQDRALNRA